MSDLVGFDVYDQNGNYIGKLDYITDIGAESLLSILDVDEREHLVPFVRNLVPEVNMEAKKIIINNIPGLIEKS